MRGALAPINMWAPLKVRAAEVREGTVVQQSVSELESAAYRSALGVIRGVEPRVADAIVAELNDQRA